MKKNLPAMFPARLFLRSGLILFRGVERSPEENGASPCPALLFLSSFKCSIVFLLLLSVFLVRQFFLQG